ncbi:MAG: hypothetical protein ACFCBW_08390 [Candidatus Competibacterales bacterium]
MATFTFPGSDDLIYVSDAGDNTYIGGGGDDTYVLTPELIAANATVTISDNAGANTVQFAPGLVITQTTFAANAVLHILSNGAQVIIDGATNFTFEVSANAGAGVTTETPLSFADFANAVFGVATPPTGDDTVAGASDVTIPGSPGGGPSDTLTLSEADLDAAGGGVIALDEGDLGGSGGAGAAVAVGLVGGDLAIDDLVLL